MDERRRRKGRAANGNGGAAKPMTSEEWKNSDLPWILSEIPLEKRQEAQDAGIINVTDLVVYHVTSAEREASIRADGLKARSSRQSYDRPSAVYFFVLRHEIDADAIEILGVDDPVILTVDIPAQDVLTKMQWDGLYNVAFYTGSSVQYFGDVPPEWIRR